MFGLYHNGFGAIVHHHWIWLALAFAIGVYIGWRTSGPASASNG